MATVTDAPVRLSEMRSMAQRLPHMLRSDAQENRDRILESARTLVSERGIDVAIREIARHAGVGPATLYRRFPTRHLLVEAVFADEMSACRKIVEDGCDEADPWRGFCSVIERTSVLSAANHGFVDAFMASGPDLDSVVAHRRALLRMISDLAHRAQAAGGLRADFVIDDFVLFVMAQRGLASTPPAGREAAALRFAALIIDGFRAR